MREIAHYSSTSARLPFDATMNLKSTFVLFALPVLASCGGGDSSPVTARVYSAAPLAINGANYSRNTDTLRVTHTGYDVIFSTVDGFLTATPSIGTAVIKLDANAILHCPQGASGGTLSQLQAGKVILTSNLQRVTNYDEAVGKTFDEFNCGGRFQPVKYETNGTVTLTFQDNSTQNFPRSLWDDQFRPEGLHVTDNGEDNRHYGEMYKIQLNGITRYAFIIRNDEVLSTGPEQSVALFVER